MRESRTGGWPALLGWCSAAFLAQELNLSAGAVVALPAPNTLAGQLASIAWTVLVVLILIQAALAAARLEQPASWLIPLGAAISLPVLLRLAATHLDADPADHFEVLPPPLSPLGINLLGPLGMTLLGAGLARALRHPNLLLLAAAFAIFFDVVVVTAGTVAALRARDPGAIERASIGAGAAVASDQPGPPPISRVSIGPADVLFLAFFLSAVSRLRLAVGATLAWTIGLLSLAIAAVELGALALPALLPLGVAVIVPNVAHARYTPAEQRALVAGGLFAVALGALIVVASARQD